MNYDKLIPIACSAFFTKGPWYDPVVLGIRWFSRDSWCGLAEVSHMGLEFACLSPGNIMDAQMMVAESLGKDGFNIKPSKLDHWQAKGNKVMRFPLEDLTLDELHKGWQECVAWSGKKGYDHPVIAKLAWRGTFLGRALHAGVRENSLNKVDCSEAGCAIMYFMAERWDLRKDNEPWGAITPQDALNRLRAKQKGGQSWVRV